MKRFLRFMKPGFFTILILGLLTPPASALIIGYNIKNSGPQSVCRFLKTELKSGASDICSATLVAPDTMALAAHCVEDLQKGRWKLEVQCGYTGSGGNNSEINQKIPEADLYSKGFTYNKIATFQENLPVKAVYMDPRWDGTFASGQDIAVIKFSKPSKLKPSILPSFVSLNQDKLWFANLFNKTECQSSGYGLSNDLRMGNLETGMLSFKLSFGGQIISASKNFLIRGQAASMELIHLFTSPLADDAYNLRLALAFFLNRHNVVDTSLLYGDSGGPLFCKVGGGWELAGIASGFGFLAPTVVTGQSPAVALTEVNYWSLPHLERATQLVWKSSAN